MAREELAAAGKRLAKKALYMQLVVMFVLVAICGAGMSVNAAKSAAIGALISILPNLVFATFAFKYAGASKNQLVVKSFSQGAKLRMAIAIILFVVAFKLLHAIPEVVFASFAITTVSYWLTMFRQQQ